MSADLEQGSDAWLAARLGKVTASRISDMRAKTKSGFGASRVNYQAELLVERLTGRPADRYVNAAMQHGTATEPEAREAYADFRCVFVEQVGFIDHPHIAMAGASPDGLVGDDGLVEIKCPNTASHIDMLLGDPIPDKYVQQMQWQMACTGRQWCDFASFDPRMPESMRLHVRRVERDDSLIAAMEADCRQFLKELEQKIALLNNEYLKAA